MHTDPIRRAVIAIVPFVLAACSPAGGATPDVQSTVRLSGSGTASPIVAILAEEYRSLHPEVSFDFGFGTNTGGGITGVYEGTLDLAIANRPLKSEERALGVGYHPFARDAMVFAVHLPNSATELTTDDIRSLYSGRYDDWSQVGGEAGSVILLGRDPNESATKLLFDPLMGGVEPAASVIVLERSNEMIDALASTPGAIGFTSLGLLNLEGLASVAPVTLDSVKPGPISLDDGRYPWVMTFALVSPPGGATGAAGDFLDFVASPAALLTLERFGYAGVDR